MPDPIFSPPGSFTNLFPEIFYDKEEIGTPILDIWNNYRVVAFPKDAENTAYNYYSVSEGDTLYRISYTIYGTIAYWWIIALSNGADNPYTFLEDVLQDRHPMGIPNKAIRLLKQSYIANVLRDIRNYKNLATRANRRASK